MHRAGALAKRAVFVSALVGTMGLAVTRLVGWGTHWGATDAEQTLHLPGDGFLGGGPQPRTVMTRAISIAVPPAVVWPWLAQMGRGAGWYSFDRLDNGGVTSARHIVSWIPPPRLGDSAAIGWLRSVEPGRSLTWWLAGDESFGSTLRMVIDIRLDAEGAGSRLVIRVSGDATGRRGALVVRVFEVVDSIMAIRQMKGIKSNAEAFGVRTANPAVPESGERDQFQLYETVWASGERAGVTGRESAARWRQDAEAAGVLISKSDP